MAIKADNTKVSTLFRQVAIDAVATSQHRLALSFSAAEVADVNAERDVLHSFFRHMTLRYREHRIHGSSEEFPTNRYATRNVATASNLEQRLFTHCDRAV